MVLTHYNHVVHLVNHGLSLGIAELSFAGMPQIMDAATAHVCSHCVHHPFAIFVH